MIWSGGGVGDVLERRIISLKCLCYSQLDWGRFICRYSRRVGGVGALLLSSFLILLKSSSLSSSDDLSIIIVSSVAGMVSRIRLRVLLILCQDRSQLCLAWWIGSWLYGEAIRQIEDDPSWSLYLSSEAPLASPMVDLILNRRVDTVQYYEQKILVKETRYGPRVVWCWSKSKEAWHGKYMEKGFPIFLAHVTTKEVEDKSEKKRLEDVPIVQDFSE
ncbi:hypothetical protein Tco_0451580 [Tanacetum coccineum]